jgi:hypothetical protein
VTNDVQEWLAEIDPNIIFFDGLDDAIIGHAYLRQSQTHVVVYDYDKIVEALMKRQGMNRKVAREYADFNIVGAYLGEFTPVIVHRKKG